MIFEKRYKKSVNLFVVESFLYHNKLSGVDENDGKLNHYCSVRQTY